MAPKNEKEVQEERSPIAIGYAWSVQILSIAIEAVVYVMIGLLIDRYFNTIPIFIIISAIWAVWVFMVRIVALAKKQEKTNDDQQK